MCTYCNFFSLTFSNFISDRLLKAVVGQIGGKPAGSNQNYPSSPPQAFMLMLAAYVRAESIPHMSAVVFLIWTR